MRGCKIDAGFPLSGAEFIATYAEGIEQTIGRSIPPTELTLRASDAPTA
jgi:hypothetical protein